MKAEKNDGESLSDLPLIAPKPQQQSATTSPMPQQ
jgi:hypothetical protein